jgi:hypothetical protein
MIDWKTGQPNARYWVLKLLKDNFGPGDTMVNSWMTGNEPDAPDAVTVQAFVTAKGKKLLFINKRNKTVRVVVPEVFKGATISVVDPSTKDEKPREYAADGSAVELKPFAVAVIGN